MVSAGFSRICITPPLGKEIPGLFEKRFAVGIHDDLYARATVVDDGLRCVALVQVDAIALPESVVREARQEARRLCGIDEKNCMLAATHTHSGGPAVGCLLSEADPDYQRQLAGAIASSIAEAWRCRRSACITTASSCAPGVAFNRRFRMKDGSYHAHPGKMNPDIVEAAGPEDPTVTVVGFRAPGETRPFGCIVHFACHATHMNGLEYSADYPRWIVDTLQAVHGPNFGVTFLNGASGDVTQVDNRSPRPPEFGPGWCRRTGEAVGAAALQALALGDYMDAGIDVQRLSARVAVRPISQAESRQARQLLATRTVTAADVETVYARELRFVEALRRAGAAQRLEIQGVRLADAVFWSAPGELFQTFALQVRDKSPFRRTCCVGLGNGYAGYICTRDAFGGSGYESRTARSSYLAPEAGDKIAATASRLCHMLHDRARDELATLSTRIDWIPGDDSALQGLRQAERRSSPERVRA